MKKCPKCGSSKGVIRIVYGLPGSELLKKELEGKILLGGSCIVDDNPDWHCKECTHEWSITQHQLSKEGLKEYYAIVGIGPYLFTSYDQRNGLLLWVPSRLT